MRQFILVSLAALLQGAYGVAYAGPQPTDTSPNRALLGTSPATTEAPTVPRLLERQNGGSNSVCGWVNNDFESAVTCSVGRTCMLYKSATVGMAGCCLGSDRQNCGWAASCVNYNQYTAGGCGSNCLINTLIRKCSNTAAPYCITYTYPGENVLDYGCDSISTTYTVRSTVSDATARVTSSIHLSTVTAAAITGSTGSTTNIDDETKSKAVKLAVGVIIGIVVAVIFILFLIVIGIVMCLKRKKKAKLLAANAQLVATNQANRQSQYQQPVQPPVMQQSQGFLPPQQQQVPQSYQPPPQNTFSPPMPPQSPQSGANGYFTPPPGPPPAQQKFDAHTSVNEYAVTPISNPSTPAPAYAQPYAAPNAPPMPGQVPQGVASPVSPYTSPVQQFSTPPPMVGAHEVDAVSVPHVPGGKGQGPVYEMGGK